MTRRRSLPPGGTPPRAAVASPQRSAVPLARRALLGGTLAALLPGCAQVGARARTEDEPVREHAALVRFFGDEGVPGCFALRDIAGGGLRVVNGPRAAQRFVPASTFKIPNTLIALEAGAVRDEREVVPYGGRPQRFPQWERDLNLREAYAASSVPIYQELARRVGRERMRAAVAAFGYGNAEIGAAVDGFWLDGPLQISAVEQTEFLTRLARGRLPVSARSLAVLRDISTVQAHGGAVLRAKSGWLFDARPQLGWWVGWVERGSAMHSFALNIDMAGAADAPKRERIGRRLLEHAGVWPPGAT